MRDGPKLFQHLTTGMDRCEAVQPGG